jgi:hypothetical protein
MNRKNFSNKFNLLYLSICKEVIYKYFLYFQDNNRKGSFEIPQFRFI